MITVDLRNYEKFWNTFKKDVVDFTGEYSTPPKHDIAKQWIKEWYDIDVEIEPYSKLGVCRMEESQFTWFISKWL